MDSGKRKIMREKEESETDFSLRRNSQILLAIGNVEGANGVCTKKASFLSQAVSNLRIRRVGQGGGQVSL